MNRYKSKLLTEIQVRIFLRPAGYCKQLNKKPARSMSHPPIRIILVDDHQLVRESWSLLLKQDNRFQVLAECANGPEAVEKARSLLPDVMLIDVNMSPMNGFETTQRIATANESIKIIGVSMNNQPTYARKMIESGARGYVTKNSSFHEMTQAIVTVANGGEYICEEVKSKMQS
jgi:DNA-binding NarL/FixJ family response regulator